MRFGGSGLVGQLLFGCLGFKCSELVLRCPECVQVSPHLWYRIVQYLRRDLMIGFLGGFVVLVRLHNGEQ